MKAIIVAALAVVSLHAFASEPEFQDNPNLKEGRPQACVPGTTEVFWEANPDTYANDIPVVLTCKKGGYYKRVKHVRNHRCVEGKSETFWQANPDTYQNDIPVTVTCHHGRFR